MHVTADAEPRREGNRRRSVDLAWFEVVKLAHDKDEEESDGADSNDDHLGKVAD